MSSLLRRAAATLAALTLAACGTADATGPDGATTDAPPPAGGAVPAELVGGWRYGSISPTNFWDDHTGVFSGNAYGFSDHYQFAANGTFKEYLYVYTQSYGCRTQAWVEMSGDVDFAGGSFTTRVKDGHFKTIDTCASSNNKDRAMTASERTERSKTSAYALKTDAAGKTYLEILDGRYDRAQ
jgi:hypothetical protein